MSLDWDKTSIQAQWRPFNLQLPVPLSALEERYCRFYHLDFSAQFGLSTHQFGYMDVDGLKLATHYYQPAVEKLRGTVLVVHGYFDHSGLYTHLIEFCLQHDYAVLIYDLPGHGLSMGQNAEIDDFHEYVHVLDHYVRSLQAYSALPIHVAGLSTGSAIIMEYLVTRQVSEETNPFASILLLAPLVRPVQWGKLLLLHGLLKPFVSSVKRKFIRSSNDPQFVDFIEQHDPLQHRRVSVKWVSALIDWVSRFADVQLALSPVVIQGDEDETVDWRYNLGMIKQKFNNPIIHLIPQARHHLVNEAPELRQQVFDCLGLYLLERQP